MEEKQTCEEIVCYSLLCKAFDNQSMDSFNPSPSLADVLKIWNVLSLRFSSPNARCTSATDMQLSMSCLFANITSIASLNSSSCN